MKHHLSAFAAPALTGLCLCAIGFTGSHAQSMKSDLLRVSEDTFVRIPALEFTVASIGINHFLKNVPLDFSRTERAINQVRPGVDYNDGMVWLTFKTGTGRGLIDQIHNLRLTRKARSGYRLASGPRYDFGKISTAVALYFPAGRSNNQLAPSPKPRPEAPASSTSKVAMTRSGPGILTVDRHSAGH